MVIKNYIKKLNELFPKIASGRKNFDFYEKRINKNIRLTAKYTKKKQKNSNR